MDKSSSQVYIVTIGNLSENKKENSLRLCLENLFTKWLRIQITTNDINLTSSQGKKAAIIHLRSVEAAQCVQHNLATLNSRRKLGFKFLQIVDPYVDIIVDVKHVKQESNVQHVKQESNVQHDTCYFHGDKIGSESRNREFKKGGGNYARDYLKTDVGVYVCAFLNSEEEGTLFIGVNDEGIVEGIECEHRKEDTIRKDIIDPGIKEIKPDIFPKNYTVTFTPVCYENKRQIGNLKVIEITVKKVVQLTQLYEYNGDVYIRRDGSKQGPLKVNQIQEWHNQKSNRFTQERVKSAKTRGERETVQLMARLDEKDQRIEEKENRIKEKEDRIKEKEERIQSLEKQNNEMARAKSRLGHRIDDTEREKEEEKKILGQKFEEEKKIIEQQMKEKKEVLEQKMEQEKTTAKQKIRDMEKREKKLKQKIKNVEKEENKLKDKILAEENIRKKIEKETEDMEEDKRKLESRILEMEQEKKIPEEQISKVNGENSKLENKPDRIPTKLEKKKNEKSSKTCVIS